MCNNLNTNNVWLTEQCPVCYSVNHIFVPDNSYHAWECYHCQYRSWLNSLSCEMFAIANGMTAYDADQALFFGSLDLKYCQGNYEKFEVEENG